MDLFKTNLYLHISEKKYLKSKSRISMSNVSTLQNTIMIGENSKRSACVQLARISCAERNGNS